MQTTEIESVLPIIRAEMGKLKIPRTTDKVYNDECIFSFDSPFSENGLYVNLVTYRGYGKDYVCHDIRSNNGRLYLLQKWTQVKKQKSEEESAAPSKLAIGIAGGFVAESEYDIFKEQFLVVVKDGALVQFSLTDPKLPEFVVNVARGVADHTGMRVSMQTSTWDADNEKFPSKYATDLVQLNPTGKVIPQDPSQWKDEATGTTENLWLNLSTGYIGGGRKNWDGSGGSGSAVEHYNATGKQYPLAVKLGTITPHGADVWSYAPDEDAMVTDPLLAQHLSFWGIDIMRLEKTDKTLSEMEVDLNMTYDWARIMEGGQQLVPLSGPGFVGLRNIGSSCYLNSVMQCFFAIPEVH
jgi:ubiquitin carboxyl-terminal hydrolase 5/13